MAPRKGGSKKSAPTVPDSDHIVFSNASDNNNKKKKDAKDEDDPPAPRPDTRKVIGGASWTGKLPVNLLSEHCQREKWNKPDYSMRQLPAKEGEDRMYRSEVTLSKTDPKTRETTKLPPFRLPPPHVELANEPSALEARHFAATYALFRISSMKNIHMMLPPRYRDLWKGEFAQLKKEDVTAKREWMYDADPFAAEAKRKEIHIAMEKRKQEHVAQAAKGASTSVTLPVRGPAGKLWDSAPRLELGQKLRADIEDVIRNTTEWNPYGLEIPATTQKQILEELSHRGFRPSHIKEAIGFCKDREEVLEWLLIHVPEDDLPLWAFPQNYSAGVSLASSDPTQEAKLKRLGKAGYPPDQCLEALQRSGGGEAKAAEALQAALLGRKQHVEDADDHDIWSEEMTAMEAILADKFIKQSPTTCNIRIQTVGANGEYVIHFRRPSTGYPHTNPPILTIEATGIPSYIRLSIVKQALEFACETLAGDQMLFGILEWLESEIPRIIENPGKLADVGLVRQKLEILEDGDVSKSRSSRAQRIPKDTRTDQEIAEDLARRGEASKARKLAEVRRSLPAWGQREAIVSSIQRHQVTIISGETGSGKSTQAVQFVLDRAISDLKGSLASIVCTQPRRISALGLSSRVSEERGSPEGNEVGYVIRGDSKISAKTKITFMTTGVLLRRLQSSSSVIQALEHISHVFVDEVHERSLDTDFLLALLKDALKQIPSLKVVLMSATLDANVFSEYFGGNEKVGRINIEGRTFPVEDLYLDNVLQLTSKASQVNMEDADETSDQDMGRAIRSLGMSINYDLIRELVMHIDRKLGLESGAILIFLPGTMEIERCLRGIAGDPRIHALPLHASLLPDEQRRVFPPAPPGKRKVIAATNVAETSITIEDVVAVIDTGKVKETRYDVENNIVRLEEVWASQAACKQRRGRAGRVRPGICYKLYTRNVEQSMFPRPAPEIQRTPLEQLCLSVKATGRDRNVSAFLAQTLTPPESTAVENALAMLHRVGALEDQQLTGLGTYMSMIPADLRCSKLLIYGCIFGCLEACLIISAIETVRSPFVSPRDKREEAKEARSAFGTANGDLLLDLAAFQQWTEVQGQMRYRELQQWCTSRFLSMQSLRDISSTRAQLLDALKDASLVPLTYSLSSPDRHHELNDQNDNVLLLRALIAGALHPQIAEIRFPDKKYIASMTGAKELDPEAKAIKYFNQENGRVFAHPSSVLFDAQSFTGAAHYVSYFSKTATSKVFIRDLTPFNPYGLLLFGGNIQVDTSGFGLTIDGWLRLRGWARIGVLVSRMRALLDAELRKRIDQPASKLNGDVLLILRKLVVLNGQDR